VTEERHALVPAAPRGPAGGTHEEGAPLRSSFAGLRRELAAAGVPDPGLEARLLLEEFAGATAGDLLARPGRPIAPEALERVALALERRKRGEPLHRILGWREFYGLRLALSAQTLEPRPDTETLVDAALPFVRETARREGRCRILDLGTGTGAIALALLREAPGAEAVGTDASEGALRTAGENAARLGLGGRFRTLRSDWFSQVEGRFHLIAANPPYISWEELETLASAVADFDPRAALDGGVDGLDAYRAIAGGCRTFLENGGRVAVEIGCRQREAVNGIFGREGFTPVSAHRDLGGNDRALVFAPSGNPAPG
jgi:release factor glutamine methyltransferase